jgi:hypothetical protein
MLKTVKQHKTGKGQGSTVEGGYIDLRTIHVQAKILLTNIKTLEL